MKAWEYYSTPVRNPWVTSEDIDRFRKENNLGDPSKKFQVAQYIWYRDDQTRSELWSLESEFKSNICQELGISYEEYEDLDPYDAIIGCPENHHFPGPSEFEEMYKYVKEKKKS